MREPDGPILLVEDEENHALLIRWAFEGARDRIGLIHADTIKSATEILGTLTPSLILCDYLLPDGSGIDFIRQITPSFHDEFPIVLLTSHGNEEIAVEAMKAGATDYIVKTDASLASMPDICRGVLREFRERQALIKKSEEKYRMLAENMGEGLMILDAREYRLTYCNPALARMLGSTVPHLLGCSILSFIDNDSKQTFLDERPKRMQGLSTRYPLTFITSTGEKVYTLTSGYPIFDDNGEVTSSFGVISDITDYRRLQEQLRQNQRLESLGRLAGGVAHDFNNKLTIILGNAELALMELPDTRTLPDRLQDITLAARHARDITAQLLAFSRQQTTTPRPIDLNRALRESVKTLARLIPGNIDIALNLSDNLWTVKIDPVQFDQIVVNLTVNARDSMPEGGRLIIDSSNVTLEAQSLPGHPPPGEYVRLTFCDTGSGMDAAVIQHIFEPFYTTKEVGKGTGLGLATIHGIITQHNGFIMVESTKGVGTVFTIHLPRYAEKAESSRQADEPWYGGNGTVLVVEDEEAVRTFTVGCLHSIGYTVFEASGPRQALELVREPPCPIDIVLTDVMMPEMNGPILMEHIRALHPGMPVLYMSGHPRDSIPYQELFNTPGLFIQKPFDIGQLNKLLQQNMHNRREADHG